MDDWKLEPAHDIGLPEPDRWKSLRRESGLISTGLHIGCWAFVRFYLSVWHRLKIHGWENVPADPPFVMVANHASHLDALVLAAHLRHGVRDRIFPIAAGDVFFDHPLRSALAATLLNALPMWRKRCGPQALRELRQRLVDEPCAFILFPEGKRSRDGQMLPFKSGLGMLVAETSVPVIPCYLDGCFAALRPETHWPRPKRITLNVGQPLFFKDIANERSGWEIVAERVKDAIVAQAARSEPAAGDPK